MQIAQPEKAAPSCLVPIDFLIGGATVEATATTRSRMTIRSKPNLTGTTGAARFSWAAPSQASAAMYRQRCTDRVRWSFGAFYCTYFLEFFWSPRHIMIHVSGARVPLPLPSILPNLGGF
ncbi:MAG: hypothetical protein V3S30_07245, partial [Thermoanaerobaculia bacterium]